MRQILLTSALTISFHLPSHCANRSSKAYECMFEHSPLSSRSDPLPALLSWKFQGRIRVVLGWLPKSADWEVCLQASAPVSLCGQRISIVDSLRCGAYYPGTCPAAPASDQGSAEGSPSAKPPRQGSAIETGSRQCKTECPANMQHRQTLRPYICSHIATGWSQTPSWCTAPRVSQIQPHTEINTNYQLPDGHVKAGRRWGQRHPQGANLGSNGILKFLSKLKQSAATSPP